MKIITFSEGQGSEEWLQWRRGGVGASDIPIILGSNRYSSPYKLWEIKCGYRDEDPINFAMGHGISNEEIARQWMNEQFHLHLMPLCVEDNEESCLRASLDGWDERTKTLVEIKCPVNHNVLEAARINQSIPSYWFDQIQWQIMLCRPQKAYVAIWDYRHKCCYTVEVFGIADEIKKMREEGLKFWKKVQMGTPPEIGEDDYIEVEDPQLYSLLEEYLNLSNKEKALSERKKEVKKKIQDFGDDGNFTAYGFKIQRIKPSVRYDIQKMKIDGIDVDKYAKDTDSIGWYRIIPPSQEERK